MTPKMIIRSAGKICFLIESGKTHFVKKGCLGYDSKQHLVATLQF